MGAQLGGGVAEAQAAAVAGPAHRQGVHDHLGLLGEVFEAGLVVRRGEVHQALEVFHRPAVGALLQQGEDEADRAGVAAGKVVEGFDAAGAGFQAVLDFGGALLVGEVFEHLADLGQFEPAEALGDEEVVEGLVVVGEGLGEAHRAADDDGRPGGGQGFAQRPVGGGVGVLELAAALVDALEDHVEVVHQHHGPALEPGAGVEEQGEAGVDGLVAAAGGGAGGIGAIHQGVGVGAAALAVEFVHQRLAGGPPEVGEVLDLIQLFGEGQGDEVVGEVGVAADGDGEALEQGGLAGATQADEQVMLHAAFERRAGELVAQEAELRLAGDEAGDQGVVAEPVGVVVVGGDAHRLFLRFHQRRRGSRANR